MAKYDVELYLYSGEAAAYMNYLMCISSNMSGGTKLFLGLGDGGPGGFNEVSYDGYSRPIINRVGSDPTNLITVTGTKMENHKQIVFPKIPAGGSVNASAIAMYRSEKDGTPFAVGKLSSPLTAPGGSLPMFNIGDLAMKIADGVEE